MTGYRELLVSPGVCSVAGERSSGFRRNIYMLYYAVVFFVIALVAAVFGFGGIAAGAVGIAKILFVVFLIGAIVTFLMSRRGGV
jgi:uncharacterized membrane protein YtjA (UPF0391 family)